MGILPAEYFGCATPCKAKSRLCSMQNKYQKVPDPRGVRDHRSNVTYARVWWRDYDVGSRLNLRSFTCPLAHGRQVCHRKSKNTAEWGSGMKGVRSPYVSKRAQGSTNVEGHEGSGRVPADFFQRLRSTLDVKEIHRVADSRILEAYLGRTRLHMMERGGGGGASVLLRKWTSAN
jgi:hypothetical protein